MPKSKVWPAPPSVKNFKLHLVIHEIKNLPADKLQDGQSSSLMVQIEWRGSGRRAGILPKGLTRNCTSKQHIQANGIVSWNEGFDYTCKLKRKNSQSFKSWIINIEIQEFDQNLKGKIPVLAKAQVDVAEFAPPKHEESIRIPVNCNIRGHASESVLMVKLEFLDLQTKGDHAFTLPRALNLRSFSCTKFPQTNSAKFQNPRTGLESNDTGDGRLSKESTDLSTTDLSSDDEPEFNYGKLAATNFLLVGHFTGKFEGHNKDEQESYLQQSPHLAKQQPSLVRLLSWNKSKKLSFRKVHHFKDTPLLNKAYREDGGDDIDNDRRHQSSVQLLTASEQSNMQPQNSQPQPENSQPSGFEDDGHFEVGNWEKKKVVSRDGQMELVTDIFLASIDQRSEKAAGGSACTVIASIVADWMLKNPKTLPLRCQFDELVRKGSAEWRKLCTNEHHKEKFSDQHFDLDTVLEAKIRPLMVVPELSYVGFFSIDNCKFLQGAMSFDSMWEELLCGDASEERIYIASWNDHFFVLKVESDVIYFVDTLGERLFEGCKEAYILRFNKESTIFRRQTEAGYQTEESNECTKIVPRSGEVDVENNSSQQVLCEGMISCKEYIKGFLAAVPLRELQNDIERGLMEKTNLHQRLQIEFHYAAPCNTRS